MMTRIGKPSAVTTKIFQNSLNTYRSSGRTSADHDGVARSTISALRGSANQPRSRSNLSPKSPPRDVTPSWPMRVMSSNADDRRR